MFIESKKEFITQYVYKELDGSASHQKMRTKIYSELFQVTKTCVNRCVR